MPFFRLTDIPKFKILVVIVSFFFSIMTPRPVGLHTGILESVASQNHPIFVLNPVQIKAWDPLKDTPTTQPRSSQNRKGRFANTAFLVGEWNRNRFLVHNFILVKFCLFHVLAVSESSRPGIFSALTYTRPRVLQNPASFRLLRLARPRVLQNPASFRFSRLARPRVIAPLLWCCIASLLHRFDASMLRRFVASLLRRSLFMSLLF